MRLAKANSDVKKNIKSIIEINRTHIFVGMVFVDNFRKLNKIKNLKSKKKFLYMAFAITINLLYIASLMIYI